jgi:hypothetical protein
MVVFRIVCVVSLAAFAFALPVALTPWFHIDFQHDGTIDPWLDAIEGSVDAIGWIALLGLLRKPLTRPVLGQYLIAVALIAATVVPSAGPAMLITLGFVVLPVVAYPEPRLLLDRRAPSLDLPMMATAAIAAAVLLPVAAAEWSITDSMSATYAEHLAVLAVAGLVSATRRPGWRWVAGPTSAAWVYLGIVAIAFPDDARSFGRIGGIGCVAFGAAFLTMTLRARRLAVDPSPSNRAPNNAA